MLNGEDEVKIEADNIIQTQTGSVYKVANYLTKSGDRYTDFQLVNQDKDVVVYGTGTKASDPIKQSAGTLVLAAGNNSTGKFVVASDAKITLVTTKGAAVLNKDADAGVATVDYTVASNGLLRYTVNYTAPSYVADNATVKFNLDVYASGKFYDTISYQASGKALTDGSFKFTDRDYGYPDDEELTFEMTDITFSDVKVEYKGTGAKVTGQDKTLTVGTDTLNFTLDTTATSGTVKYTVTQGKTTLVNNGSINVTNVATSKDVSASGLTITDDAPVVVTIEGMDKLTELYKVTLPTVAGYTFSTIPAAAATTGVAAGTEVYVYVAADSAPAAYGVEVAVAGYDTVVLTDTTKTQVAKITMSKDVTLTATATAIAALAQDGTATASADGKTITV